MLQTTYLAVEETKKTLWRVHFHFFTKKMVNVPWFKKGYDSVRFFRLFILSQAHDTLYRQKFVSIKYPQVSF